MQKAIVVDHLGDISFTIQSGEFVGLIGSKGSAVSSIMKVLTGLLITKSGFISVLDFDPWSRQYDFLKQISLVDGQKSQLWWDLPLIKSFEFTKEIYHLSSREYQKSLDELVNLFGISDFLEVPVKNLPLEEKMKADLLNGLLHNPKILFLNEPKVNLDFLYEYTKKRETTILIATSNVDKLINIVRRVIILGKDKILFDGAFEDALSKYAQDKIIKFTVSSEVDVRKIGEIGPVVKYSFPEIYISVPRSVASFAAAELLQNYPITSLTIEELPLEEITRNIGNTKKLND